jgi:two-component system, chemotaxis family, chemotaxis protein CheY
MPAMDGLTALKEIRTFDPSAKVVMLAALGQESVVLEAIKAGARDFLVKPFERERIQNTIEKVIKY